MDSLLHQQRIKAAALAMIMIAGISAMPQSAPQVKPTPPCADTELRRAMAEARVAAQDALIEACNLHLDELAREGQRLKQLSDSAGQSLASEQKKSARLSVSYQGSQEQVKTLEISTAEKDAALAEQRALNAAVTAEREKLKSKIETANKQFLCRTFHLGCIGER